MKLKSGKEEIAYLLGKVIEKFENETGLKVIRNSNRKNYESVARVLSDISNRLPFTAETLQHEPYPPEVSVRNPEYPFRKYDITGNQIKDAYYNQIVTHPRPFLVDACYIYLFGTGRKGFLMSPSDNQLSEIIVTVFPGHEAADESVKGTGRSLVSSGLLKILLVFFMAAFGFSTYFLIQEKNKLKTLKRDFNMLPYLPSKAEIDSLEGVWLCYTGSPQARSFDPDRYHMVVSNIAEVKYKDGYFSFIRYGSNFNHAGFMQFESPGLVSVHSRVVKATDNPSPKHSLLKLENGKAFVSVISASWNFDVGERNRIIGIREVFIKLGNGGTVKEIFNEPENALCRCKIIKWTREDGSTRSFQLKNESLDGLPYEGAKTLLNESSILLKEPEKGIILSAKPE